MNHGVSAIASGAAKAPIVVVGAIIENDNAEILCALRSSGMSMPGLWEFPGGKIEPGEESGEALVREILEELGCAVRAEPEVFCDTTHEYDTIIVRLLTIRCAIVSGEPRPREHERLLWLPRERLASLRWAPADLPAVRKLEVGKANAPFGDVG